jgi:hypothetical protein
VPAVDEILIGLREIANAWRFVAIIWHVYFGALVVALAAGIRPSRRVAGVLLGLPLVSVSTMAWLAANPFNGLVFSVLGIVLILLAAKLPRDRVQITSPRFLIPGLLMFVFGWIYPHFLETAAYLPYLYSAPTGLIPCPTLSIVIGAALILDGLGSRRYCGILGVVGLFYAITGVAQLRVTIDALLLFGVIAILVQAFTKRAVRSS